MGRQSRFEGITIGIYATQGVVRYDVVVGANLCAKMLGNRVFRGSP